MSTVQQRLNEAHGQLLKLYTDIPILNPCLEMTNVNHDEFVRLNSCLRQLAEAESAASFRVEKTKRQADAVFALNKAELERAYHQELDQMKKIREERRTLLRQKDDIVSEGYKLKKQRDSLLECTRQLKRLNESVFDRSKDEVANTDFPEELHWQLELKDYDYNITEMRRQVTKFSTAATNLSRAANLCEAALMAFLGYPEDAYKVWRAEYTLKASQKMRLYLRVELSLSNAYSNEFAARSACPSIIPVLAIPIKPSSVQSYFERVTKSPKGKYVKVKFTSEEPLRSYIAQLRASHKVAEMTMAQETERLNAVLAYRESIIPTLSRIRRHVFQNSCLGGYQIEGWEDAQGYALMGLEADNLVRGGLNMIGDSTLTRSAGAPLATSSSIDTPAVSLGHGEDAGHSRLAVMADDPSRVRIRRGHLSVSAVERVIPLSTLEPGNLLGSEVLMEVDRQRQAAAAQSKSSRRRSRSRHGRDGDNGANTALGNLILNNQAESSSNDNSGGSPPGSGEREGRRKSTTRSLFSFARGRKRSQSGSEDAVQVQSRISLSNQGHRSSIDLSSNDASGSGSGIGPLSSGSPEARGSSPPTSGATRGHQRNVPSISISTLDGEEGQAHHPLRRTFFENGSLVQLPSSTSNPMSLSSSAPNSPLGSVVPNGGAPWAPGSSFSAGGERPRVMSMDDFVGIGESSTSSSSAIDRTRSRSPHSRQRQVPGSAPLIPSYEEHQQHLAVDPDLVSQMTFSTSYDGALASLAEQDEEDPLPLTLDDYSSQGSIQRGQQIQGRNLLLQMRSLQLQQQMMQDREGGEGEDRGLDPYPIRVRSRSVSPQPAVRGLFEVFAADVMSGSHGDRSGNGNGSGSGSGQGGRASYQQHSYSFSDQTPDGRGMFSGLENMPPPPDYVARPPDYSE